jgi:hypothetical protein
MRAEVEPREVPALLDPQEARPRDPVTMGRSSAAAAAAAHATSRAGKSVGSSEEVDFVLAHHGGMRNIGSGSGGVLSGNSV